MVRQGQPLRRNMHTDNPTSTIPVEPPAIACTLDATGLAARIAEFQSLFTATLRSYIREPLQLRLVLSVTADGDAAVRGLFERESRCCQFFRFTFQRDGDTLVVGMNVAVDGSP